jgi:predicted ATPase
MIRAVVRYRDVASGASSCAGLVFRRLAIFAGGFSLAAALQVASEGLDPAELTETLATLVDKSLVTSDGGVCGAL